MSEKPFDRAAKLFLDRVAAEEYFGARRSERARRTLEDLIEEGETPLLFLLGEPGSGKTQMLRVLEKELPEREVMPLLFPDPFSDRLSLLRELAQRVDIQGELDEQKLKEKIREAYEKRPHLIMVDEAQLLKPEMLEFIRILADTGAFKFLLAMHREEGEAILSKPHFRSRTHRVVEMGALDEDETLQYIQLKFRQEGLEELVPLMDRRQIKKLHRLSRGNFRMTKRLLNAAFELMDEAQERKKHRYVKPCDTIWCMAAMRTGVRDA